VVLLAALLVGCTSAAGAVSGRTSTASRGDRTLLPRPTAGAYQHGRLLTVRIPGGHSAFRPRPAYVYLPPALAREPDLRLPVLELLHGNPGLPSDWQAHGGLTTTLDAFAAQHGGRAPIVVMPDINGSYRADSECVRAHAGGNVEEYLTVQVPQYVLSHLPASPDRARWALAGLSEGGMCSLLLALRAYPSYRAFGDFSGLAEPSPADSDDAPRAISELFGGSRAAFDQHDPLWLIARRHYPGLAGWFFAGASDHVVAKDQATVASAAQRAGVEARSVVVPGMHDWAVWVQALQRFLPWLWPLVTHGG